MKARNGLKVCSSCRAEKPVAEFHAHLRSVDKLQGNCKACKTRLLKDWKYSLKSGDYDRMREAQHERCAICQQLSEELVIDHCHKTKKLRELLCRKCNALLGMCGDDVGILERAIAYVMRWTEE